ncbi:MAG: peptidoglycan glycosyltransferase [Opitutaceae bacterium]|nr:peptidoglycan glycosyltransferase [Opitutaceae bacterium]
MATTETNLAGRSGSLVESHKSYQPRVIFFHFATVLLLVVLTAGLAYQQIFRTDIHRGTERMQNQRRILVPGPRGNIYDRTGRLLVGNRPRLAVVLYLDELRSEIYLEYLKIRNAYRESGDKDLPTDDQMRQIARASVVQRYLDQVNLILKRDERVKGEELRRHFLSRLLLPFVLIEDLEPVAYARLVERLPVRSPLQVYTSSTRYYPFHSAAAHTLGYIGVNSDLEAEDFPGEDLTTLKMKGTVGRDGLEKRFDLLMQGETGGTIFRVDPAGYKVNPPIERRMPVHGKSLTTSLDIELQLAAEEALGDRIGSVVALDVKTGEVLVLASKPDYDLSAFSPRLSQAASDDIETRQAWRNHAIQDAYPPGSTFKILTTIAALRSGSAAPDELGPSCNGFLRIVNRVFTCDNGDGHHGALALSEAIAMSCDIYFYTLGIRASADAIAIEARRFHLDQRTGIELPNESSRMLIPDQDWKLRVRGENWFPGDTANMSIGQGDVLVTPLDLACFAASVARNEVCTKPTLLHQPNAPVQHTEPIGLTPVQRAAILAGMEGCVTHGTAKVLTNLRDLRVPNVRIAGKTGTAQISGNKNVAWFICFAPLENPEIALAVAIEGEKAGETYSGGMNAAPVAAAVLKKYFAKKNRPVVTSVDAGR